MADRNRAPEQKACNSIDFRGRATSRKYLGPFRVSGSSLQSTRKITLKPSANIPIPKKQASAVLSKIRDGGNASAMLLTWSPERSWAGVPDIPVDMIPQKKSVSSHIRRCVVMIDGSPCPASSLSLMLERSGHLVHHLAFGKAALSKVVRLKPDAVLLIGLPDADVRRLASALRKKLISRRARIISISLFARKIDSETNGDSDHYFMIPGDEEDLVATIEMGPGERDADSPSYLPLGEHAPRLLLVEDSAEFAEATAEFLSAVGLEVRIVESGEEALATARVFQPEIILCDRRLPDMSGLDVARALRANPNTKYAVFALHSAISDVELRALEREIDADEVNLFLSKPLTQQKLDSLLSALEVNRESTRSQRNRRAVFKGSRRA
jgi:CheY-like chemotaxis protein